MSEPQNERCETCRFWRRERRLDDAGDCRRYPPQIFTVDGDDHDVEFPATSCSEWCGEWQPPKEDRP